jgi:hypothetical protein
LAYFEVEEVRAQLGDIKLQFPWSLFIELIQSFENFFFILTGVKRNNIHENSALLAHLVIFNGLFV